MTLHFKQVIALDFSLELCELIDSTNTTQKYYYLTVCNENETAPEIKKLD
jgi:hypothetical protein